MEINKKYAISDYIPVVHAGDWLSEYLKALEAEDIDVSSDLALGGLVPRLLSTKGSSSRKEVIDAIKETRDAYPGTSLHVFGIGGLTTLHLAAVLEVDSIDSVGWRIRAAYGSIFITGKGERSLKKLGSWNGTEVSEEEMEVLKRCSCPACKKYGLDGLMASKEDNEKEDDNWGALGAYNRATHNLWTLLREAEEIEKHLKEGNYSEWYKDHVKSPLFRKLIDYALNHSGY
jgi:7-cyano-7-deazaguanine tRNA-ribosyltransferase